MPESMYRLVATAITAIAFATLTHTALADESDEDAGADAEADAAIIDAGPIADASIPSADAGVPTIDDEFPPDEPQPIAKQAGRRRGGELVLLYFAGIGWGGSMSLFFDGLVQSGNPYASANPAGILLSPVTAGFGVALPTVIDIAYGHRTGVAQTVTTSMVIGLGEAIALNEFFSNHSSTSFHTFTKDTAWVFGGSSLGLAVGLTVAGFVHTTPGRAAWIETSALFSGLFAAGIAGAAATHPSGYPYPSFSRDGLANIGLTAAVAGGVGVIGGVASATWFSPSVLRVHIIDAGWLTGAVASALACNHCPGPDTFMAMAVGSGIGFLTTFLATIPLKPDHGAEEHPRVDAIAPFAMPVAGGFTVGFAGPL